MPLADEFKNIKIVPLGNYHDETEKLPDFYKEFSTDETAFTSATSLTSDTIQKNQGKNIIIDHKNGKMSLLFDSSHYVAFENKEGTYNLCGFYQRKGVDDIEAQNLDNKDAFKKTGKYPGLELLADKSNREKITQVFSTQFSSCGFQLVLVGKDAAKPDYLIFCHVQLQTCLPKIIAALGKKNTDILGIINHSTAWDSSIADCFGGYDQGAGGSVTKFNSFFNDHVKKKSITFIKDRFFWPYSTITSGFGIRMCGYQILPGYKVRLATAIGYDSILKGAPRVFIDELPYFNCTPQDMIERIERVRTTPAVKRKLFGGDSLSKEKKSEIDYVAHYYFYDLFLKGWLGDHYFISRYLSENNSEDKKFELLKQFIKLYTQATLHHLKDFMKFKAQDNKFVLWKQEVSTQQLVQDIAGFKAPASQASFIDIDIHESDGDADKGISKLSTLMSTKRKTFHQSVGRIDSDTLR